MNISCRPVPGSPVVASLRRLALAGVALLALSHSARAADVYVTSSGDISADAALIASLTGFGHNPTLGAPYTALDGTQNLSAFQTVYLQYNYNWNTGGFPEAGQTALVNYVNSGGGLVTTEWLLWAGAGTILNPIMPSVPTSAFNSDLSVTFTQQTADPILNAGLSSSFLTPLESIAGTRTNISAVRPGATVYYDASGGSGTFHGLTGWNVGAGRVLNFTTVNGAGQIADPNFARLLSNTLAFSAGNPVASTAPEPGAIALFAVTLPVAALTIRRRR